MRSKKFFSGLGILLPLFLSGCFKLGAPTVSEPFELPVETGLYSIGSTKICLTDTARKEVFLSDRQENRKIMVRLWYPTDSAAEGKTMDYMDGPTTAFYTDEYMSDASNGLKMMSAVKTHSIENAAVAGEKFPVLIFSHGLGADYNEYQTMLETLASHGYIVAAINHTFISGITVFPDGQSRRISRIMSTSGESMKKYFYVMTGDVRFVISNLIEMNGNKESRFYNKMDISKMGNLGHSYGGATTVEILSVCPEIKAGVNIEGWLLGEGHTKQVNKPLLFVSGDTYTDSNDPSWPTAWKNYEEAFSLKIAGATHINFGDLGMIGHHFYPEIPLDLFTTSMGDFMFYRLGKIDPVLAVRIADDYILAFFDYALKGSTNTFLKLSGKYDNAQFERIGN